VCVLRDCVRLTSWRRRLLLVHSNCVYTRDSEQGLLVYITRRYGMRIAISDAYSHSRIGVHHTLQTIAWLDCVALPRHAQALHAHVWATIQNDDSCIHAYIEVCVMQALPQVKRVCFVFALHLHPGYADCVLVRSNCVYTHDSGEGLCWCTSHVDMACVMPYTMGIQSWVYS
jgi:hypothetical protein